jgi:hypothetical protein
MAAQNLTAFDPSSLNLALADGDDLLIHGGTDEKPLWIRKLQAKAVGVGAGGGIVCTLDDNGLLTWWSGSGEVLGTSSLGDAPLALATAPDGQACAALFDDRIVLVERGAAARTVRLQDVTAAAFSADGGRVAIGTAHGQVKIMTFAGEPIGESKLEDGVRGLAASPKGHWYATSGDRVLRIDANGGEPQRVTRAAGLEPDLIAVSSDGLLFAVRLRDDLVMCLGDPPHKTVAQIDYPQRTTCGLGFGKGHVIVIGLEGGDGNYVNIPDEQLCRTETFEGRTHNRWLVGVNIDASAVPGAPPRRTSDAPPSSAPAPKPALAPQPAPAPAAPAKQGGGARSVVLGLLSVVLLVAAVWWKVSSEEKAEKEERDRETKERIQQEVGESVRKSMKK